MYNHAQTNCDLATPAHPLSVPVSSKRDSNGREVNSLLFVAVGVIILSLVSEACILVGEVDLTVPMFIFFYLK